MRRAPRSLPHNLAFLIALGLMGALGWQGLRLQQALLDGNADLSARLGRVTIVQDIAGTLSDLETGERGFVLTGDELYLEPFVDARERIDAERARLAGRASEFQATQPTADEILARVDALITRKVDIAEANIRQRREEGLAAAANGLRERGGRETMGALRQLLQQLEDAERAALGAAASTLNAQIQRARQQSLIGGLLVVLLFLGVFWAISRNLEIRRQLVREAERDESRLRVLVQAVPDRLLRIAPDGSVSPMVEGTADPGLNVDALARALASRPVAHDAFEWRDDDGHVHDVRVVATPGEDRLAVVRDITRSQALQSEVREQRTFLRSVVDADVNLVLVLDRFERIALCNRALASLVESTPDALEGRRARDREAEVLDPLLPRDEGRNTDAGIVELADLQGRRRSFQVARHELTLPDGREGRLAVAVDLSERLEVERLKTEFVSTVSHELRTPLTAIRGALAMLGSGTAGPIDGQVASLVGIAEKNCERLVRLINDILDIEKLDAGHVQFSLQPVEIDTLVAQAVADNAPLARERQVELVTLLRAGGAGLVLLDPDRFAQVMANLLSNACKHSPPDGRVEVTTAVFGDDVIVAVSDQGQGIPAAFRARVFERFAQADSSDVRRSGGTGLGLTISRSLVEHMGGRIGFDTEDGQGTRFHVRFPSLSGTSDATGMSATNAVEPSVLLVGSADHRLADVVGRAGACVHAVATAGEAREWLHGHRTDLVVTAPELPDENGLAFLRWLRGRHLDHAPTVVVARLEHGGAVSGGSVAVADWVDKPAGVERLIAAIRRHRSSRTDAWVLHVEDDADLRALIAHALAAEGVPVVGAGSLAHARDVLAARGRPGLVVLDLALPDGEGFELLGTLAGHVPAVPVVVFSARDAEPPDPTLVVRHLVKTRHSERELVETVRAQLAAVTHPSLGDSE